MFGLMQPANNCGQLEDNNYLHHRMHYCGTCKVIGKQYGHKSRLALNFDTVFLAELLSHLSNEQPQTWSTALQAVNKCFTMPKDNSSLPLPLQYAATANILLAELKIQDHIQDHKQKRWKLANWALSKPFHKAKTQLDNWAIDSQQFQQLATKQTPLEQAPSPSFASLAEQLTYYAQPTAQMTALIFEKSVKVIDLKQENIAQQLAKVGFAFGQLAYMLDALEDIEKDIKQQQFNPLVQWYKIDLSPSHKQLEHIQKLILEQKDQVIELLQQLPIDEEWVAVYAGRLTTNVANSIYQERKIYQTTKKTVQSRWQSAKERAVQLTCPPNSLGQKLNYYLVSVAVFMAPEALPVEPNEKAIFWKSLAIFTAMLFTLGLASKFSFGRVRNCQRACEDCCNKLCKLVLFFVLLLAVLVFLIVGILGFIFGPLALGIVFTSLFVVGLVGGIFWYAHDDDLNNC